MSNENQNWLQDLFIDEAKAALDYHNRGGESGGSDSITEISSAEQMDSILGNATPSDVGDAYIYTGETTESYENRAIYIVREAE